MACRFIIENKFSLQIAPIFVIFKENKSELPWKFRLIKENGVKRSYIFWFAIWLMLNIVPLSVFSQPIISGDLSGALGPGEYIVVGDCRVPTGQSLQIMPRTILMFSGHYQLIVSGQLIAEGTFTDSIKFIRQHPTEACRHGGIRFQSGVSGGSTLSYCLIDHAKNSGYPNYNGGGINSGNTAVTITNCWISNCYASSGGGLYANDSYIKISDCVFFNNTAGNGGGIYLNKCQIAEVNNCLFIKNSSTST